MHRVCSLLTLGVILAACDSSPQPSSAPGEDASADGSIELEFIGELQVGGQFRLANQTSRPIAFNSVHENADGAQARDVRFMCKSAGSDEWGEGPRPMDDSPANTIEVPPGAQETVFVLWEPGVIQNYAACRVDLRLADGTVVESGEFPQ